MILGALWYGPFLGQKWLELMDFSPEKAAQMKKEMSGALMGKAYGINFLGALVASYVLAHFIIIWGVIDIYGALQLAFWVWLGFIATTTLGSVLWERKPWELYILNNGYQLIALAVASIILTFWQ